MPDLLPILVIAKAFGPSALQKPIEYTPPSRLIGGRAILRGGMEMRLVDRHDSVPFFGRKNPSSQMSIEFVELEKPATLRGKTNLAV